MQSSIDMNRARDEDPLPHRRSPSPPPAPPAQPVGSSPADRARQRTLDGSLAAALERVAQLAATSLGVRAAAVMLLGEDRRCFAGGPSVPPWLTHDPGALFRSGLATSILSAGDTFAIADAGTDSSPELARTARQLGIGRFIGVNLVTPAGEGVALFCAFDSSARSWAADEIELFQQVAASAITELELQRHSVEAARVERQHRHDALHDPLTGLPNRVCFVERLNHTADRAKRHRGSQFAVVFIDLDNFKAVNDSHGHLTGDELLIEVARRLSGCVRGSDTLARLGGDEFAVLVEDLTEVSDVAVVAGRLQGAMTPPVTLGDVELFTSASMGIAVDTGTSESPQHLLRSADLALYRAKERGRARFQMFDPAMHDEAVERLAIETDLRRALEREQLSLHYQPVLSILTGNVIAVEALLRWDHPTRGMVPPATFIPVAERTGLIMGIGRWVLRRACQQLQTWDEAFGAQAPYSVWVNVSAKQFGQAALASQLMDVLRDLNFDPRRLKLEITEGLLVEDVNGAIRTVMELQAIGVQVYMDDFGTGYSSLTHLARLPMDGIKIERTFIREMETDPRQRQLVRTLVNMIQNLGMEPIAEGVETSAQLDMLREMGCVFAQGFLFSRPVDGALLGKLLHQRLMPQDLTSPGRR